MRCCSLLTAKINEKDDSFGVLFDILTIFESFVEGLMY